MTTKDYEYKPVFRTTAAEPVLDMQKTLESLDQGHLIGFIYFLLGEVSTQPDRVAWSPEDVFLEAFIDYLNNGEVENG